MPTPEQQAALEALVAANGGEAIRPSTQRKGAPPPPTCFMCGRIDGKLKRQRWGRGSSAYFHAPCFRTFRK